MSRLGRRQLLALFGWGGAAALGGAAVARSAGVLFGFETGPRSAGEAAESLQDLPSARSDRRQSAGNSRGELLDLLSPHGPGTMVSGLHLDAVFGVRKGAAAFVLRTADGEQHQVDLCARDDQPGAPPVAGTRWYALCVANGGSGALLTHEGLAGAVSELARAIENNEGDAPSLDVLTLRHRLARFPGGAFSVT